MRAEGLMIAIGRTAFRDFLISGTKACWKAALLSTAVDRAGDRWPVFAASCVALNTQNVALRCIGTAIAVVMGTRELPEGPKSRGRPRFV